jgi:antirestriction protein
MTSNSIEVFQKAAELGLKLGFEPPDTLTLQPASRCPADFTHSLREHKPQLLALLRLPFVMVESQILEETIFFCQDEDTKAALVEAGADEWSIYTKEELRVLVAQNRVAPLSIAELRKVHEIKRTFNGRIAK